MRFTLTGTSRIQSARRRRRGRALGLLAIWLALPAAASADGHLRLADGELSLRLDEAVEIALRQNLSLSVERFRRDEADLLLEESRGIYDLVTMADLTSFDETTPAASNLDGADIRQSEGVNWNFTLSRLVPSGGTATLLWNNSRFQTNSTFALLNPSFNVDFDLRFSQPLLRNAGRDVTERGIRIANNNVAISDENFELQVTSILYLVEDAYWTLVEAQAQLGVAEESLALARKLDEQNKVRVEVGTLAPLELVQSKAGVATRQEEIIRAQAAVGDAEDRLRQLLNLRDPAVWAAKIVTESSPEMEPVAIDVDSALEIALAERPELRAKRLAQQNLVVDSEYFANQALPNLDLTVTYGYNGLGGDITARDFFTGEILFQQPGGYGDALDQITRGDFDGWSAGLSFAFPVNNRAGKARRALAEVAVERGEAELDDLELEVTTGVRRLARLVAAAAEAREAAAVSRDLEERNVDAEQKRYQNGMSTSFQVLQIQEDLTAARSREVSAITAYRKALAQYYQALGQLIEQRGVEIASGGK